VDFKEEHGSGHELGYRSIGRSSQRQVVRIPRKVYHVQQISAASLETRIVAVEGSRKEVSQSASAGAVCTKQHNLQVLQAHP